MPHRDRDLAEAGLVRPIRRSAVTDRNLRADRYETVPEQTPGTFPAAATFVVQGERFTIAADEIVSVFPPALANGEFAGALPHVVFSRRTLPWERSLRNNDKTVAEYPWLAILVFDDATAPTPTKVTAKDLVPMDTPITVTESPVKGAGNFPPTSFPTARRHSSPWATERRRTTTAW